MIVIAVILFMMYAVFIVATIRGFNKLPEAKENAKIPKTAFSILIPFKDEAANLNKLLNSLQQLNYPADLFEIILINDHSSDSSEAIVKKFSGIQLLQSGGKGKKSALQTGMQHAKHPWIITTDADCEVPENWLHSFDQMIQQKEAKMLLGPVKYFDQPKFLAQFQQFEFLSLQGITAAAVYYKFPFLANGANLCFQKQAFNKVNGYNGNENIASGDDMFLLEKFAVTYPDKIYFVKNRQALVQTKAAQTLPELIHQKIRWAGKSRHLKNKLAMWIGLLITLINLLLVTAFTGCIWLPFLSWFILFKFLLDGFYIWQINRFYKAKLNPVYFVFSFIIYPFYFFYIGLRSLKGNYQWKNRNY